MRLSMTWIDDATPRVRPDGRLPTLGRKSLILLAHLLEPLLLHAFISHHCPRCRLQAPCQSVCRALDVTENLAARFGVWVRGWVVGYKGLRIGFGVGWVHGVVGVMCCVVGFVMGVFVSVRVRVRLVIRRHFEGFGREWFIDEVGLRLMRCLESVILRML